MWQVSRAAKILMAASRTSVVREAGGVRCRITQQDLNRRTPVRHRKGRMHARTRDRLPLLPIFVRATHILAAQRPH
jgi:hypothetical protein